MLVSRSLALAVVVLVAASTSSDASAEPDAGAAPANAANAGNGNANVTASCERAVGPGRVRCEAEINVPSGAEVRWADVQIVVTPAFVSALKGRIGPADAMVRDRSKWRFSFGLVARGRGTGEVKLRMRAVVCREDVCGPELVPVTVAIVSGG